MGAKKEGNQICGTLKFGRGPLSTAKIGDPIPVHNLTSKVEGRAIWSGFAREEKLSWWMERGDSVSVIIPVILFEERHREFNVPVGYGFMALGLRRDVEVRGKIIRPAKSVSIITRPAETAFELNIHSRWPVLGRLNNGVQMPYIFTAADIAAQAQQEMF